MCIRDRCDKNFKHSDCTCYSGQCPICVRSRLTKDLKMSPTREEIEHYYVSYTTRLTVRLNEVARKVLDNEGTKTIKTLSLIHI